MASFPTLRAEHPDEKVNYVTICDQRGCFYVGDLFGGQLLRIFSLLGYAWDHGLAPYFSKEILQKARGAELSYPYVYYKLPQDLPENADKSAPIHIGNEEYEAFKGKNVCLCATRIYFPYQKYRDKFRSEFSPHPEVKEYLMNKYQSIINHPNTVAVHVRTFHPLITLQVFLGIDYYKEAMSRFSDDSLFVIFSDRVGWCKENFEGFKPNMVFIENENHIADFYLMTLCVNHIISNSNFSLMAAFLKKDPSGLTLVPDIWLSKIEPEDWDDLYFPGCTKLKVNLPSSPNFDLLKHPTASMNEATM